MYHTYRISINKYLPFFLTYAANVETIVVYLSMLLTVQVKSDSILILITQSIWLQPSQHEVPLNALGSL